MTSQSSSTPALESFDSYLGSIIREQRERAAAIHPRYERLWTELQRIASSGGKHLRPQVLFHSYEGYGGRNPERLLPIAAAIELLHLTMLIHDDIIDRDIMRRGTRNMTGAYLDFYQSVGSADERMHYAESAALLAGDAALTLAYRLLFTSDAVDTQVFNLFDAAVFEVVGGELLDTESPLLEQGAITSSTVMRYKTSGYSFVAPLLIGAHLAGDYDEEALRNLGELLGTLFQLRDDYIGVFGDETQTGKSTTGDLREGKRTRLIELFYESAGSSRIKQFEALFGQPSLTDKQADSLRDLLTLQQAPKQLLTEIDNLEQQATSLVESLQLTADASTFFRELVIIAARRNG